MSITQAPVFPSADECMAVRDQVAKRLELVKNGFVLMLNHDGVQWQYVLKTIKGDLREHRFDSSMYDADTLANTINAHHMTRP